MRRINFSSGDNTPSNDVIKLSVAMESDSKSSIYIHESEGKMLLTYATDSDYVFNLERFGRFSGKQKAVKGEKLNNISYDSGIAWVPGRRVATNSESLQIEEDLRAPLLSSEDYFTDEEVEKSNTIVIDNYYDDPWVNSEDYIEALNIQVIPNPDGVVEGQGPFIEIVEGSVFNTGQIDIHSADLSSTVFSFEIRKNLKSDKEGPNYSNPTRRRTKRINYGNKSLEGFIEEWNSIFNMTVNANINSRFRDGTNVDEYFVQELKAYLNEEWDGKIKRYLWKKCITDTGVNVSSDDPGELKKIIFNQIKNYGTSDDIRNMAEYNNIDLSWHIGVGGIDLATKSKRFLSKALIYMPELESFEFRHKVGGFAPRGAYFANRQANLAMSSDIGNSSNTIAGASSIATTNQATITPQEGGSSVY